MSRPVPWNEPAAVLGGVAVTERLKRAGAAIALVWIFSGIFAAVPWNRELITRVFGWIAFNFTGGEFLVTVAVVYSALLLIYHLLVPDLGLTKSVRVFRWVGAFIRSPTAVAGRGLDREDRAIVRKFTKPVEVEGATANGFAFKPSPVTGTPVLDQAVAYVDCRVWQAVECGTSTFFIGEVVDAGFQRAEETDVLRMEDTRMNYGG